MYDGIEFYLGEVVDVQNTHNLIEDDSPDDNQQYLNTIKVLVYSHKTLENDPVSAKPYNLHNTVIPYQGEHVLLFKGYSPIGSSNYQWYYWPVIGMGSTINSNLVPNLIDRNNTADSNLRDVSISPIQIYPGDNIIQGRFGNTIRLGSTVNASNITENPTWNNNSSNPDPIIILSNTKENLPGKKFVVERIDTDYSSLWLTSTQNITSFTTNYPLRKSDFSRKSKTTGSQFIGSADRIILKAKADVVALDSDKAIELNAPIISMGTNEGKEPTLHSTAIIQILGKLIEILKAGTKKGDRLSESDELTPLLFKLYNESENKNILQDTFVKKEDLL